MPQVAREFDTCDHGAAPIGRDGKGIDSTVFVNGLAVAVSDGVGDGATGPCGLWMDNLFPPPIGDLPDTHPLGRSPLYPAGSNPPGIPGPTTGSDTVFVGGFPIHRFNDDRGCGAETITASPNVWADFVAKIRIEGATVNNPIYSSAAPKNWIYPSVEFFQFILDDPGMFYVKKNSAQNLSFSSLDLSHFAKWGTTIVPTLEFEDITDKDKFKVPDLDLAVRKSTIPLVDLFGVPNITDKPDIDILFAGGLFAKRFPSFGEFRDISGLGYIKGVASVETWQDFYEASYDISGYLISVIPTGYSGYPFYIANESGNALTRVKLINIPTVPYPYFSGQVEPPPSDGDDGGDGEDSS